MVSEVLNNKKVFESEWMLDELYDPQIKSMIDTLVDRLVFVMRLADVDDRMPIAKVERLVVRAFRRAESKYYGLDKKQLEMIHEMRKANDKGRKRNK